MKNHFLKGLSWVSMAWVSEGTIIGIVAYWFGLSGTSV
jgi:hypothetical protein